MDTTVGGGPRVLEGVVGSDEVVEVMRDFSEGHEALGALESDEMDLVKEE